MEEFQALIIMNKAMLKLKKKKGMNYLKNLQIEDCLEDQGFFFKVPKEVAFDILREIGIDEEALEETYNEVISRDFWQYLVNSKILNSEDQNLAIKY
jgi:hypothetical protein